MKTIKSVESITLKVCDRELLFGKYVSLLVVASKLRDYEETNNLGYKSLRTRFYNSCSCRKYNIEEFAEIKFLDITNPMKAEKASLVLKFTKTDKEVKNENNV